MKHKIDSAVGRMIYRRRLGTVEPVLAHICHVLGLNRFSLRGRTKVTSQWRMFLVHNIAPPVRVGICLAGEERKIRAGIEPNDGVESTPGRKKE
jgi:hypothetical protein